MKRQILLCTLLVLSGLTLFLVSPTLVLVSSKGDAFQGKRDTTTVSVLGQNAETENSIIQRGYSLAPVPLDLRGKNRALVGLGSYIVNTGGCSDCHTNPPYVAGGDPFAGEPEQINTPCYLSGGMEFGPFRSRNLTPDENGLPGGLTLEQFIHTLRTGEDQSPAFPGDLLQVMPWPVFGKKTDRDLTAIYEYLRSIPSRPRCLTEAP